MADKQNEKEDTRQWFLRINGETVFGPVSTQGLVVWAEQGRILPGHEVSSDRKKWVQAVSLELLDMRWFVDDGAGELRGPLNRLAAEALIKSGKVPEGAQLVSADEVEADAAAEQEQRRSEKPREPVPEEVLRQRIRELETMVSEQRARLTKLSDADAHETVQQERDVLVALLKETETQRDTILRNAEKDSRAHERKLDVLRQQVKKLEQQLEDANSRLLLSAEEVAGRPEQIDKQDADRIVEEARREAAELARREGVEHEAALQSEAEAIRMKLAASEQALAEARAACERLQAGRSEETGAWKKRLSELEQALQFHERRAEETAQILGTREAELEEERARAKEREQHLAQAEAAVRGAEAKARQSEVAFAELLNDANARDTTYQEKIAVLEKACAQPPEETARFFADQAAVYELVKAEIEELSKTMDLERSHVEQLKELSVKRQQILMERRQTLLKHMGGSPGEMTRRAVREQPSDPQVARMRAELENLRVTYQREVRLSETKEREHQDKVRVLESESSRLLGQVVEGEKKGQRVQELEDLLRRREHELSDERRNHKAERDQFVASQQALLMRIETLEKSAKPATPEETQSAEAHNVKLATWMRLKR